MTRARNVLSLSPHRWYVQGLRVWTRSQTDLARVLIRGNYLTTLGPCEPNSARDSEAMEGGQTIARLSRLHPVPRCPQLSSDICLNPEALPVLWPRTDADISERQ